MLVIQKRDDASRGIVVPKKDTTEQPVKNTFFFPDIAPARVRALMRLEQSFSDERLRDAIRAGIAETNAELYDWRAAQVLAGITSLADVPAEQVDGESVRVFWYLRAVASMTAATLYERYRGADTSARGEKKAMSLDQTVDELWRDMRWSVARIQDKARCMVGSI